MPGWKTALLVTTAALVLEFAGCDLFSGGGGMGGSTGGGATAPAAPTGFTVGNPAPSSLTLSWNSSTGATSYQVLRDTTSAGSSAMLVYNNNGTGFTDSGLASSSSYYYWIQASNSYGSSVVPASPMGTGTTLAAQAGAPSAPTGLTVSAAAPILTITWSASTGATGYLVYRDTSSGGSFTAQVYGGSGTTFSDIPTPSGSTFYYTVQATNANGSSARSSATGGTQALGTNSFQPLFGACIYATNDSANYGSPGKFYWKSIGSSTLSLNGTVESLVSKSGGSTIGDIGIIFDYWVDTYSQPNFWMFNVDYTSPTGYYTVYRYIGGASPGWSKIVDYTQNANVATYAGAINDLKVTYSFTSPNYILSFYVNGTLLNTWSGGSALHGGTTGFMAEVMNASYGENFPTSPVIDEFVQLSPTSFSGNMFNLGPSGSQANTQVVPPSQGRSIAPPTHQLTPLPQ